MDDFVFSSSFNLANMTCQLVELGSINPLKPISTSWNIEIAKLKLLSLRLGCFLASLQYPNIQPDPKVCVKFIYSEKATKFCEISTVDLTVTTL